MTNGKPRMMPVCLRSGLRDLETMERVQLVGRHEPVAGAMALAPTVGIEARGGPVVGRDGSVLGLVAAPDHMILAFNMRRQLTRRLCPARIACFSSSCKRSSIDMALPYFYLRLLKKNRTITVYSSSRPMIISATRTSLPATGSAA